MSYILDQIKKAEALGIVGDSQQIRLELMEKVTSGIITHEQCLKELKKIQKKAHKEGLLIRSDFTKNKLWDFDIIQKRITYLRHDKMQNEIPAKQNEKKTIIKI